MTKLRTLRSQLNALRARRQFMRLGTGYAGLLIALLWILLAVFLLDFGFELIAFQRAIILAIGAAGLVWAAMKYTAPFLGERETEVDMALLVERQHGIDSDLVAALQFESEEAEQWGSRELEEAVVDYVAQLDRGLNVFEGISHEQFRRRMGILAVTVALVIGLAALWPGHAHAFLMRLALDNVHYPSDTQIERVLVNGEQALAREEHGTSPASTSAVQGRPVVFAAWAAGDVPDEGGLRIYPETGGVRQLELTKVDRQRLRAVQQLLESHLQPNATADPSVENWTPQKLSEATDVISIATGFDGAELEQSLQSTGSGDPVEQTAWRQLKRLNDAWDALDASARPHETTGGDDTNRPGMAQLFVAKLPRLLDPAEYSVFLGDAWTDRASISMIALPVIEPRFIETPPKYARRGEEDATDPGSLQRTVLEGSQLNVAISSSKPLQEATFTVITTVEGQPQREVLPLVRVESGAKNLWPLKEDEKQIPEELWGLNAEDSALSQVQGPFRFEIQVTDEDGLSLDRPLRGAVRLKADRAPRISGTLVHRAVLPTATPEVELRAGDDYGIAAMQAQVSVIRGEDSSVGPAAENETTFPITRLLPLRGNMSPAEAASRPVEQLQFPLQGDDLPKVGAFALDLSALSLERGDEVRIVLEATDYRGELEGLTSQSEPIILDITDESGVLAAVSEGDRRSQEQIDDLIRRQLGIGEIP